MRGPDRSMALWSRTDKIALTWLQPAEAGSEALRRPQAPQNRLLDTRQHFELMERRRRGQRPFQRGGTDAPRAVRGLLLADERIDDTVDEDQHREAGNVRADRRHQIPAREGVRVIDIAARHARQAQEVLREEHQVDADEGDPEMRLGDG